MTHTSCISHPARNQCLKIHSWQVLACDGDVYAAALLSHIEELHNKKCGIDEYHQHINAVAELHGAPQVLDADTLIPVKFSNLRESLFNLLAEKKISERLTSIAVKGFISIHNNPDPEKTLDRTKYIRFYPEICNAWILANYDNKGSLINPACGQVVDSAKRQSRFRQTAESENQSYPQKGQDQQVVDIFDNAKKEERFGQKAESRRTSHAPKKNNVQVVDIFDNAKRQSPFRQKAESRISPPIDQSIFKINSINPNQATDGNFLNSSKLTSNNLTKPMNEVRRESPQVIADALVLYGFSENKLNYPDVIPEIGRLQLAGATLAMFMEAYDISARVTKGRGFGFKYLVKAVEGLLTKTKKNNNRPVESKPKVKAKPTVKPKENVYENDLSNAQSWAADLI